MTVEVQDPFNTYTAAPGATVFPYSFKIVSPKDLIATIDDIVIDLGIDFSLSGVGNNDGGNLTLSVPLTGGQQVLLKRQMTFDRKTDYQQNGDFNSPVVNNEFDRIWLAMQQLGQDLKRSIKTAFTETTDQTITGTPAARANKALVFDASGNITASVDDYKDQAAAAAASAAAAAAFQAAVALDADEVEADRQAAEASAAAAAASAASIDPTKLLHTTGNETKSGILTLTNSPVVPTPTEANQAANKSYVDSASALRGHISGLMLSTAGSSATMSISAGQATDSGGVALMKLLSAISKTTSAWAVGSGNGGLDAGTIANNTWYHFYEIMRADTGVVDVNFSLSGSAPTLPANYTNFRRIGSGKTNGSGQWNRFTQNGDVFEWADPVQDVSVVNQGATSVTYALSVPPAVVTRANILAYAQTSGGSSNVYIRPLTATDAVASAATNVNLRDPTTGNGVTGELTITTNTSSQIAVRASGAVSDFKINTKGWIDRRGRDA